MAKCAAIRVPMVPAPRMATLLIRLVIEPFKISNTGDTGEHRATTQLLRQFIYRPVVVASVHHDNTGEATARIFAGCAKDENNREFVAAGFEQFALTLSQPAPESGFGLDGPPDMEKLLAEAAKYQLEILGPLPE